MLSKTYAFFSYFLVMVFLVAPVVEASAGPDLKPVLTRYKSYRAYKDIEPESTLEKEAQNYIQKEGLLEEKLPNIELKDDSFHIDGEIKTVVKVHHNKILVKVKDQTVTLDSTMSTQEMVNKLLPLFETKTFSFMSLFIEEAQAVIFLPILAVAAVVTVVGMIINHLDADNFKTANMELERLEKLCPKDATFPRNKSEQAKLRRTLDKAIAKIDEVRVQGCEKIKSLNVGKLKIEKKKTCEETLPRVQACFENLQVAFDDINDTDRSIIKDTHERSIKRTKSAAKAVAK
jgi:hypothetical protein